MVQMGNQPANLSLYKITGVRPKPFTLLLWAFHPETVGARTLPELYGTKTLDTLTINSDPDPLHTVKCSLSPNVLENLIDGFPSSDGFHCDRDAELNPARILAAFGIALLS
ncbi:hypothetical protein B0H19DRAFT_1082527 [Mycena capillaripes]|nr:hypothetical protein B0H19DRAFT_1082527 [Mycena capillaripes]